MKIRRLIAIALVIVPLLVLAAWPTSSTDDVIVSRVVSAQLGGAISDDDGGLWVTWTDARNGSTAGQDLFAEHVGANAELLLGTTLPDGGPAGKLLLTAPSDQHVLAMCTDTLGGFFMAWSDTLNVIRLGHFDANGNAVGAFSHSTIAGTDARLLADKAGGAYIQVLSPYSGGSYSVERFGPDGTTLAGPVGAAGDVRFMRIDHAGDAGIVVLYTNYLTPYAQGFTPNLATRFGPVMFGAGITGGFQSGSQFDLIGEPSGGAWAYFHTAQTTSDVWLQRIEPNGNLHFKGPDAGPLPATVSAFANQQSIGDIELDGTGGVWVSYFDARSGTTLPYLQRVDSEGVSLMNAANGGFVLTSAAVSTRANGTGRVPMVVRPDQDVTVIWGQENPATIFAQRWALDGGRQWPNGGVVVSIPPAAFTYHRYMASVALGDGAVATASTYYAGTGADLPDVRVKRIPNDGLFYDAGVDAGFDGGSFADAGFDGGALADAGSDAGVDGGGTGGGSGGSGGGTGGSGGGTGGSGGSGGSGGGTGGSAGGTGGTGANTGSVGGGGGSGGGSGSSSGCGCGASPAMTLVMPALFASLLLRRRRRAGAQRA